MAAGSRVRVSGHGLQSAAKAERWPMCVTHSSTADAGTGIWLMALYKHFTWFFLPLDEFRRSLKQSVMTLTCCSMAEWLLSLMTQVHITITATYMVVILILSCLLACVRVVLTCCWANACCIATVLKSLVCQCGLQHFGRLRAVFFCVICAYVCLQVKKTSNHINYMLAPNVLYIFLAIQSS